MNIEKATNLLQRARLETKDPTMSEIFKLLTDMAHEINIVRSEVMLLTLRVEQLENSVK